MFRDPLKSEIFSIAKRRRFGRVPKTALYMDLDFEPAAKVNV